MDKIIDDWYTVDQKSKEFEKVNLNIIQFIHLFQEESQRTEKINKSILDKMDEMNIKINEMNDKISHLEKEHEPKIIELKKISLSLDELRIIKEREMNALLREHIPFPFNLKHVPKIKTSMSSFKL